MRPYFLVECGYSTGSRLYWEAIDYGSQLLSQVFRVGVAVGTKLVVSICLRVATPTSRAHMRPTARIQHALIKSSSFEPGWSPASGSPGVKVRQAEQPKPPCLLSQ